MKTWTGALKKALDNDLELQSGEIEENPEEEEECSEEVSMWDLRMHIQRKQSRASKIVSSLKKSGTEVAKEATKIAGEVYNGVGQAALRLYGMEIPQEEREQFDALNSLLDRIVNWIKKLPLIRRVPFNDFGDGFLKGVVIGVAVTTFLKVVRAAISGFWALVSGFMSMFGIKPATQQSNEGVAVTAPKKTPNFMRLTTFADAHEQVGVPPNEAVHDHVYMNTVKCVTDTVS